MPFLEANFQPPLCVSHLSTKHRLDWLLEQQSWLIETIFFVRFCRCFCKNHHEFIITASIVNRIMITPRLPHLIIFIVVLLLFRSSYADLSVTASNHPSIESTNYTIIDLFSLPSDSSDEEILDLSDGQSVKSNTAKNATTIVTAKDDQAVNITSPIVSDNSTSTKSHDLMPSDDSDR